MATDDLSQLRALRRRVPVFVERRGRAVFIGLLIAVLVFGAIVAIVALLQQKRYLLTVVPLLVLSLLVFSLRSWRKDGSFYVAADQSGWYCRRWRDGAVVHVPWEACSRVFLRNFDPEYPTHLDLCFETAAPMLSEIERPCHGWIAHDHSASEGLVFIVGVPSVKRVADAINRLHVQGSKQSA